MVRAALEEGLAHHTPETLRELIRTGVYKGSKEEAQLEREQRKVRGFLFTENECRTFPQ